MSRLPAHVDIHLIRILYLLLWLATALMARQKS